MQAPARAPSHAATPLDSTGRSRFPAANTPGWLVRMNWSMTGPPVRGSIARPASSDKGASGTKLPEKITQSHGIRRSPSGAPSAFDLDQYMQMERAARPLPFVYRAAIVARILKGVGTVYQRAVPIVVGLAVIAFLVELIAARC